jgi:histone-lysine N-methyltransferase EZH2
MEGYGLFTGDNIKRCEFVLEYSGELITTIEAERRGYFYEKRRSSYLFDVATKNGELYHTIDATRMGNSSRFINHSSTPNLVARNMQVNGRKRIGFYSIKDIKIGEELFFNYNFKEEHKQNHNIKE